MKGKIPKININHIPLSNKRRPGLKLDYEYVTIHNTANPTSSDEGERNWLISSVNTRTASWHYAVDDNSAIEAIPPTEVAWHAGDGSNGPGNRKSVSIEVCESGDFNKTWVLAVGLAAKLLLDKNLDIDKLTTHQRWSGKNCPRLILPRWNEFKNDVQETMNALSNEKTLFQVQILVGALNVRKVPEIKNNTIIATVLKDDIVSVYEEKKGWYRIGKNKWISSNKSYVKKIKENQTINLNIDPELWKNEGIEYLYENKLLEDKEQWLKKRNENAPVWMVTSILSRIHKDLKK